MISASGFKRWFQSARTKNLGSQNSGDDTRGKRCLNYDLQIENIFANSHEIQHSLLLLSTL